VRLVNEVIEDMGIERLLRKYQAGGGANRNHPVLNDFRGKLLTGVMEEIFVTAMKMLKAKGYIKVENYSQTFYECLALRACKIFCVIGKVSSERNPFFSELNGELVQRQDPNA
jgi:hypothetical protein